VLVVIDCRPIPESVAVVRCLSLSIAIVYVILIPWLGFVQGDITDAKGRRTRKETNSFCQGCGVVNLSQPWSNSDGHLMIGVVCKVSVWGNYLVSNTRAKGSVQSISITTGICQGRYSRKSAILKLILHAELWEEIWRGLGYIYVCFLSIVE
jgi:hypothetical protein